MNYPIFVYGTLMAGERAFALLVPHSICYCEAILPNARLYASPDGYPYAAELQPEARAMNCTVWGEVHWLRADGCAALLARLDQYEGDEYTRQVRSVLLCDRAGTSTLATQRPLDGGVSKPVDVWLYLCAMTYASQFPSIANGDWRQWQKQGKEW